MEGLGRQIFAAFVGSLFIFCCGMAYGWLSPVLKYLADKDGGVGADDNQISWIAADIELGCLITPFLASFLMDKYGRKRIVMLSVPLQIASWIITITTRSVATLYIKRVLDGMAQGFVMTVIPVYLAEVANTKIRGSILLSIPITWYAGMLFQFCLGTYLPYNLSASINLTIPIIFLMLFTFLPESPYYLIMKKQEQKAADSLSWYRNLHVNEVSGELSDITEYVQKDALNKESWTAMVKNPVYRKCLSVMSVVLAATIMTGFTTIISYATEMFNNVSIGFLNADTCSVAIGVLFFTLSIVICFLIDKIGRRPLVVISSFGCFLSNLSSACYFYYKDEISYNWIPFLTIGSYCFFVSIGLVPVMMAYQGELFPSSIKGFASGLTILISTCLSLATVKYYYIIETSLGLYVNYCIYALIAGVATIWLYLYAPETKNRTFSELYKDLQVDKLETKAMNSDEP